MNRNQLLAETHRFTLRRQVTVAELNVLIEAVRETEIRFCADVYVGKNAGEWWIWAIVLYKIVHVDSVPHKQRLATVCTAMEPFNVAHDPNAAGEEPPVILLKRGKRPKTYKTLSGLYADAAEILGSETPIDLHIHGELGEVGND